MQNTTSISKIKVVGLSGLAVLLLGGGFYFAVYRNIIPSITYPTTVTRPKPNGFDLYVASSKAIIPAKPPVDQVNDPIVHNAAEAAIDYSLARKEAWRKNNVKALELFAQAMKTPTMHPDTRGKDIYSTYGALRELARCKVIEANTFKLKNQPARAAQSSLDCIQMGADISNNSNLIGMLVATAIQAIGRSILEDFDVTINQLNAAEAKAAAARLEQLIARNPSYLQCLKEDRWNLLKGTLDEMQKSKGRWRKFDDDAEPSLKEQIQIQFLTPSAVVGSINRVYDQGEKDIVAPYDPAKDRGVSDDSLGLVDNWTPSLGRVKLNEVRRDVGLNLLLLRLALRAFRVENNRYPQKLAELSPKYLKSVPTDDYANGKPFFYRLKAKGYELWSVGPDGKNDNAKPIEPRGGSTGLVKRPASVLPDSPGDWVAGKNR